MLTTPRSCKQLLGDVWTDKNAQQIPLQVAMEKRVCQICECYAW